MTEKAHHMVAMHACYVCSGLGFNSLLSCLFVHYMVVVFFYSVVIVFVNFCFTFLMRKDLLICFFFFGW